MAGLLDQFSEFASTPQGQGLLAAAFGGLAGARRGQPLNSIGRAGLSGLAGYTGAQDRITQQAESAVQRKFREMQMQELERKGAQQVAQDKWRAGFNDVMTPKSQEIDQFTGTTQMVEPSREVVNKYLLHKDSPYADELVKQKLFPKPQEAFTLSEGQVRYGPNGQIVAKGPDKPADAEDEAKIKQFKFAKANGYKGSFDQFVVLGPALMAAAAAPLRDAQVGNINAENAYNLPPPVAPRPVAGGGGISVSAGGKTYTFPDQASAIQFKARAGLK